MHSVIDRLARNMRVLKGIVGFDWLKIYHRVLARLFTRFINSVINDTIIC